MRRQSSFRYLLLSSLVLSGYFITKFSFFVKVELVVVPPSRPKSFLLDFEEHSIVWWKAEEMWPLSDIQRLLKTPVGIICYGDFVDNYSLTRIQSKHHTDGNNLENWAVGLSSNNFRLLCLDGGVRPVQEYQTCNLGKVPAPKVSFSVLVCSEGRNSAFFFVR